MNRLRLVALVVACALSSTVAAAEPITLRFATAAPEGTAWARLFHQMARDIETSSNGELKVKFYLGGIAGSELQMLARMQKGQLDGVLSGGMLCMRLSPSMRALRLLGLFQTRAEASYALGRLRNIIDKEFDAAGYKNVGEATLGSDMIFSRVPVASLAALKKLELWYWDLDEPMRVQLAAIGISGVGLPVEDALKAYEDKRTDGFIAIPTAALAYQWSSKTPYLSELRLGYLPGCMAISHRAFDSLTMDQRNVVVDATGRFQHRLEELGREQDQALLATLFARQGVKITPVSDAFTTEFFEAARIARQAVRDKLIPGDLMDKVTGWLADYRAEYGHTGTK